MGLRCDFTDPAIKRKVNLILQEDTISTVWGRNGSIILWVSPGQSRIHVVVTLLLVNIEEFKVLTVESEFVVTFGKDSDLGHCFLMLNQLKVVDVVVSERVGGVQLSKSKILRHLFNFNP